MAKLTLSDITGGYQTVDAYNANNALIEAAIENTLSRDGTAPNTMNAEFDMNSQNINNANIINAQSIVTPSITLDGQAVSLSTTLTGGLDASEVTYDAGTLTDKLNDEFPKLADAETVAGAWTFSDALTLSAGLAVTGNITVTGNVDGIDIDALNTAAVQKTTAVTGHVRAGNEQALDRDDTANLKTISGSTSDSVYSTFGPTGSGATVIWDGLDDAVAAGARIIKCLVRLGFTTNDTSGGSISLFACEGSVPSPGVANDDQLIARLQFDPNSAGATQNLYFPVEIPVTAAGIFQATWVDVNGNAFQQVVELTYKGFVTD